MGKKAWNMGDRRLSGKGKYNMFFGALFVIAIGAVFFNFGDNVGTVIGAIFVLGGLSMIFGGIRF